MIRLTKRWRREKLHFAFTSVIIMNNNNDNNNNNNNNNNNAFAQVLQSIRI